jgi:hypothetical protein
VGTTQEKAGVSVSGGFFTIADLDFGTTAFEGNERFLEIAVKCAGDADYIALSPRQLITATPYALSLRPGAKVSGGGMSAELATMQLLSISPLRFALIGVRGEGTWGVLGYSDSSVGVRGVAGASGATTGTGVFGLAQPTSGTTYGVYGKAQSPGGYGGYFENAAAGGTALYADGKVQSSASSYLWISGNEARVSTDQLDKVDVIYGWSGSSLVRATTAGSYDVMIPISLPTVLYGQNVKVTEVIVYYSVENAGDKIDLTQLRKNTGAGTADTVVDDGTDRNSTTATQYALPLSGPITLSETSGHLSLRLLVNFTGTGASRDIAIGGVRLTLKHE